MGSYFTSLVVAVFVVVSMLGLLAYSQEPSAASIDAEMAKLGQVELIKIAIDEKSETRVEAILQLAQTPGELPELVPVLSKLTMDSSELVRNASGIALQGIGIKAAPFLRPLMESANDADVAQACATLKEAGGAELYLPILKKWLASPEVMDRRRALFALQGSGEGALQAMDLLVEALSDPDFNNQCMACRVLEGLGTGAMAAEEEVIDLFKTGNPSTRSWAAVVLGAMGPTDKTDTAAMLGDNLKAFLQIEKQRSLLGLAHLGPEASSVTEKVRELMLDGDKHVQPHAAYALWRITGQPEESLKVLAQMMDDPSYVDDAIEMLGKFGEAAAPLVGKLVTRLESPEEGSRELAVVAIGNIGPAAANAIPAIKKLLEDQDALIRYAAKEALKQIESGDVSK